MQHFLERRPDVANLALGVRNTPSYDRLSYVLQHLGNDEKKGYLGHGKESIVYDDPLRAGLVCAIDYALVNEKMRREHLLAQNVMSKLFPNTFPIFYDVWEYRTSKGNVFTGSDREKLKLKKPYTPWRRDEEWIQGINFTLQTGIFRLDPGTNMRTGKDGFIKYVDTIDVVGKVTEDHVVQTIRYMDREKVIDKKTKRRRSYTQEEKAFVQANLHELQQLTAS